MWTVEVKFFAMMSVPVISRKQYYKYIFKIKLQGVRAYKSSIVSSQLGKIFYCVFNRNCLSVLVYTLILELIR